MDEENKVVIKKDETRTEIDLDDDRMLTLAELLRRSHKRNSSDPVPLRFKWIDRKAGHH